MSLALASPPDVVDPKVKRTQNVRVIRPNPGAQEDFLATPADFAITGGKAGTGKTYGLLLGPVRHIQNPSFGAVTFRRECPQITNEGGLWDKAGEIYPRIGAQPHVSDLSWIFPSGARHRFCHMQYEVDRYKWDGSEIPLLQFDQLEHFTWKQFWHLVSRNRSTCGIRPYIRGTCNPNPDHWLRTFIDWWIDKETGFAIKERSGVIRWFVVVNDAVEWADTKQELIDRFGGDTLPLSFTFIPGDLDENSPLLEMDPGYKAKLAALPKVERERLAGGNWNVRETAGTYFQKHWFETVPAAPALDREVRYWDRAASEDNPLGSWTAGVRMGKDSRGVYYITDVVRFQGTPMKVREGIRNTASQDGTNVTVKLEQDPGQAGKAEAQDQVRNLAGYIAGTNTVRESKGKRALGLSAQAEAGNVKIVRGPWNDIFKNELENFDGSDKCMADQVDAASGAFYCLTNIRRAGAWGR